MADELISRQAALELQYLGYKRVSDTDWQEGFWDGVDDICDKLRRLPAADAVPVVLCKDCRSCYDGPDDYCCTNHKGLVSITPLSFCSYGERREENAAD